MIQMITHNSEILINSTKYFHAPYAEQRSEQNDLIFCTKQCRHKSHWLHVEIRTRLRDSFHLNGIQIWWETCHQLYGNNSFEYV